MRMDADAINNSQQSQQSSSRKASFINHYQNIDYQRALSKKDNTISMSNTRDDKRIPEHTDHKVIDVLLMKIETNNYLTVLDTKGQYDAMSIEDRRQVVSTVQQAISKRGGDVGLPVKDLFKILEWRFDCPKCKWDQLVDEFQACEFTLSVPAEKYNMPDRKSRCECARCAGFNR